jgi:hypothetical protein
MKYLVTTIADRSQTYHFQLMSEIQTLFQIYCALCGEHAKAYEHALARAIFFVLFEDDKGRP